MFLITLEEEYCKRIWEGETGRNQIHQEKCYCQNFKSNIYDNENHQLESKIIIISFLDLEKYIPAKKITVWFKEKKANMFRFFVLESYTA